MPLFFALPENISESEKVILIYGKDAKHIIKSLRYKKNDEILIANGKGNKYITIIESIESNLIKCKIIKSISTPLNTHPTKVVLAQALVKSNKMDFIVQKSTELGINAIIPFISSRTIPIINRNNLEKKQRRWQKIAYEASKQSERSIIPEISSIITFNELLNKSANFDLPLLFWENERSINLKDILTSLPKPDTILGLIGPEGGFSEEEIRIAKEAGLTAVSLGNHYLRSETAALFVLSVITYIFDIL